MLDRSKFLSRTDLGLPVSYQLGEDLPMLSSDQQKTIDTLCQTYKGPLRLDQIAEGIAACIDNAAQLYDDGLSLLNANRHPRAMSLFIAAMEEVGKVSVLCSMSRIPSSNQALWSDYWRDFRCHRSKATRAFVHTFPEEARKYPAQMGVAANMQFELSPLGESFRQAGMYVDFLAGDKCWMSPSDVPRTEAESWKRRLDTALSRVQEQAELGFFSTRALEIQREVYGPINTDRPKRKDSQPRDNRDVTSKALAAHQDYYRRLVDEGILNRYADIQVMGVPLKEFIDGP